MLTRSLQALFLVLYCLSGAAAFAEDAGYVYFARGDVSARNEQGASRALHKGDVLTQGDAVITGKGALAQIKFTDGALVSLQPNSNFRIDSYRYQGQTDGSEKGHFSLLKGGLRTITGTIGKQNRDNYKLDAVVATIGIRGTEFTVQLDASLKTLRVHTGEGLIEVNNAAGSLLVGSGESARIDLGQPPVRTEARPQLPPPAAEEAAAAEEPAAAAYSSSENRTPSGSLDAAQKAQDSTPPAPPAEEDEPNGNNQKEPAPPPAQEDEPDTELDDDQSTIIPPIEEDEPEDVDEPEEIISPPVEENEPDDDHIIPTPPPVEDEGPDDDHVIPTPPVEDNNPGDDHYDNTPPPPNDGHNTDGDDLPGNNNPGGTEPEGEDDGSNDNPDGTEPEGEDNGESNDNPGESNNGDDEDGPDGGGQQMLMNVDNTDVPELTSGPGYAMAYIHSATGAGTSVQAGEATFDNDANLQAMGFSSEGGTIYQPTDETAGNESHSVDGVIGWGYWATAEKEVNSSSSSLSNFHYVVGQPTSSDDIIALGNVSARYDLIGGTTLSGSQGHSGTLSSGTLDVNFANGSISTTSLSLAGTANETPFSLTGAGTGFPVTGNEAIFSGGGTDFSYAGFVAGTDASHAGVSYKFNLDTETFQGAAAFSQSIGGGVGTN